LIDSESMAKIFEFRKPEPAKERDKSCSWCQNRNTHPLDPPCARCKWYDRDTVFDLEVEGEGVVMVRKEVDPDTFEIRFIPAEETDIEF